ncbi:unnamed protein product [Allacma fusca]|uniref:Uncharacterized protein n=1 Tax=Allacma fusca TaxID=39272 RepID=A0A8J2P484_9HEXA|nr:unnamed protein product [Allacma fusca]
MAAKVILCCGSEAWTKVIGWLQIVSSIFGIFVLSFTWSIIQETVANSGQSATVVFIGFFLWNALCIFMAILLLRGVHTKNPGLVQTWRIYYIIYLIIWTIFYTAVITKRSSGNVTSKSSYQNLTFPVKAVILVIAVALQVFFFIVVGVYKKDITRFTRSRPIISGDTMLTNTSQIYIMSTASSTETDPSTIDSPPTSRMEIAPDQITTRQMDVSPTSSPPPMTTLQTVLSRPISLPKSTPAQQTLVTPIASLPDATMQTASSQTDTVPTFTLQSVTCPQTP